MARLPLFLALALPLAVAGSAMTRAGPAGRLAHAPSAARQDQLLYLLRQDCGSCHGLTLKGGLGPPLLPAALAGKPDEALIETILNGVPRTPMAPWAFEISRAEAAWLVRRLKAGLGDAR